MGYEAAAASWRILAAYRLNPGGRRTEDEDDASESK